MKQQRRYETPVSEILCMMAEDVVTASGFGENSEGGSSSGWNNEGNGNGNGRWFDEKPGKGGKKD